MPGKLNREVYQLAEQFYNLNKDRIKSNEAMARAYLQMYPNCPIGFVQLCKGYFALFKKGTSIQLDEKVNSDLFEREESNESLNVSFKAEKNITSLEEALTFFEVDTKIWEPISWKCKSWDTSMNIKTGDKTSEAVKKTNYAVNVVFKRREEKPDWDIILKEIDAYTKTNGIKLKKVKPRSEKTAVVAITDLHMGADTQNGHQLIALRNMNVPTFIGYLNEIAETINNYGYKKVHLAILGDLVETVTGANHPDMMKSLTPKMWGSNGIIICYEILKEFIGKIHNVEEVYIVSGNHDRLATRWEDDKFGGAAHLIAYMLNRDIQTTWHSLLLKKVIDNICYLFAHGHHAYTQKDMSKMFFEYGDQSYYNVMLCGHFHHRRVKKLIASEKNMVEIDTNRYRVITVAPLYTGVRYAEEEGYVNSAGFTICEANDRQRNINHFDFGL